MKALVFVSICAFVTVNAVPKSWETFHIDRHIKKPSDDTDDSYSITLCKTHDDDDSSESNEEFDGDFNAGVSNKNGASFDDIVKRFNQLTSQMDQIVGANGTSPPKGSPLPNTPLPDVSKRSSVCESTKNFETNSKVVLIYDNPIDEICANDTARVSSPDDGPVVIFGLDELKSNVVYLDHIMSLKGLIYDKTFDLPANMSDKFTKYKYRAYVPAKDLGEQLDESVEETDYNKAVYISTSLDKYNGGHYIQQVVDKFIEKSSIKLVSFAYKLWQSNYLDILSKYFPKSLQMVVAEKDVELVHKTATGRLSLKDGNTGRDDDRDVLLDCRDLSSNMSSTSNWRFEPIWSKNKVTFKVWHPMYEKYIKIQQEAEQDGRRILWGGVNEWYIPNRFIWTLVPLKLGATEEAVYCLVNIEHNQAITSNSCNSKILSVFASSAPCSEGSAWQIFEKNIVPQKV